MPHTNASRGAFVLLGNTGNRKLRFPRPKRKLLHTGDLRRTLRPARAFSPNRVETPRPLATVFALAGAAGRGPGLTTEPTNFSEIIR